MRVFRWFRVGADVATGMRRQGGCTRSLRAVCIGRLPRYSRFPLASIEENWAGAIWTRSQVIHSIQSRSFSEVYVKHNTIYVILNVRVVGQTSYGNWSRPHRRLPILSNTAASPASAAWMSSARIASASTPRRTQLQTPRPAWRRDARSSSRRLPPASIDVRPFRWPRLASF
jgi:hypothetical protein